MTQAFHNAATRTIQVKDTRMVYRELGERGGVPVVFLHHLTAVLDDWDPKVLDGIAGSDPLSLLSILRSAITA